MSKLYTEEQMIQAFAYGRTLEPFDSFDDFIASLTPIQLPTDEEIEMAAPYVPRDAHDYYVGDRDGFIEGAKWYREQLKLKGDKQ